MLISMDTTHIVVILELKPHLPLNTNYAIMHRNADWDQQKGNDVI